MKFGRVVHPAVLLMLWLPLSLNAATWQQQISLPLSVDYDTNPLMESGDVKELWKKSFTPHYGLRATHDNDQWTADISLRIERTSDQNISMNREDPVLSLGWMHEMEKSRLGLTLGYDESSSRATTLDELGVSIGSDTTRVNKSLGLSFEKELSDRLTLNTSANATKMIFRGQGGDSAASAAGSKTYDASANLSYLYTEYLHPYLRLTANRSDPDATLLPATNVYGTVFGAQWFPTQRLLLDGNWGMNQVTGPFSDRRWQAAANLSYQYEKSSINVAASRSVSPSGNGGFIASDQFSAGLTHEFSDRARAGTDFYIRKTNGLAKNENSTLSAWYERDISPDWGLRASYSYKKTDNNTLNAHGNTFGISLGYNFSEF